MKKVSCKRTLKISRKTVARSYRRCLHLPSITITGIWLQECGFEIGDHVEVSYAANHLIITLCSK